MSEFVDTNTPNFENITQLTNAVSSLGNLLDSFKREQMLLDQNLKQLKDENYELKTQIAKMENSEYLSTDLSNNSNTENVSLKRKLQSTENLVQEERMKKQELERSNDSLRTELAKSVSVNESLEKAIDVKNDLLRKNQSTYNDLYTVNSNLKSEIESVNNERDKLKNMATLYKSKLKETFEDLKRLKEENERLSKQRDDNEKIMERIAREKRKLEDEITVTKKRLSQLMGNKVTANNPGIADLSDQNRPTKLAEKYSELYDNEWTDAYEVVEELYHDEEKAIKTLLTLLQNIRRFCTDIASTQIKNIRSAIAMTFDQTNQRSEHFSQQLKDIRKATSVEAIQGVIIHFLEHLHENDTATYTLVDQPNVQPFMKKCVELCWLMAVQDPPLELAQLKEQWGQERFNSAVYRPYTMTGSFVDFVVWPPLYIYRDGPLLAKGVAQACRVSANDRINKHSSQASAVPGTAAPALCANENEGFAS